MKKLLIVGTIFLALALIVFAAIYGGLLIKMGGGEDRTFHDQYIEAAREARLVLVSNGLCKSVELCAGRFVFVGGMTKGFYVEVYGIVDQNILSDIAHIFAKKFFEIPKIEIMRLRAYKVTKKEKDIILDMTMSRKEGNKA